MIFSGEMDLGIILREAKYVQKCTFEEFPTIFEFGQFFRLKLLHLMYPF